MAILLTQSQVSVALSSTVVVVFTLLLFLSGYALQQQTVKGLQDAIRPRMPQVPPTLQVQQEPLSNTIHPSRLFGGSLGSKGRIAYQKYFRVDDASVTVDWKKLAHIQLTRNHHDVCNAIMVLAELHRLKSPARRILLFPQIWAAEEYANKGDISDPFLDSSRRLMRMAARRYGVELRPVSPVMRSAEGAERSEVYSLASAVGFTDFDRVLNIETPGLLLDASPLDAVLAFTESAPFAMLHDTAEGNGVHTDDLFLIQPSRGLHEEIFERIQLQSSFNDTQLGHILPEPLLLAASSEDSALIKSIGVLHEKDDVFNSTQFFSQAAYIRFSDPKLPGPEYDVPWSMKRDARPSNKDADWAWTKLYGQFAQKRMDICGLDLESWRP